MLLFDRESDHLPEVKRRNTNKTEKGRDATDPTS